MLLVVKDPSHQSNYNLKKAFTLFQRISGVDFYSILESTNQISHETNL